MNITIPYNTVAIGIIFALGIIISFSFVTILSSLSRRIGWIYSNTFYRSWYNMLLLFDQLYPKTNHQFHYRKILCYSQAFYWKNTLSLQRILGLFDQSTTFYKTLVFFKSLMSLLNTFNAYIRYWLSVPEILMRR